MVKEDNATPDGFCFKTSDTGIKINCRAAYFNRHGWPAPPKPVEPEGEEE